MRAQTVTRVATLTISALAMLCVSCVFATAAFAALEMQLVGRFGPEVNETKVKEKAEGALVAAGEEDACTVVSGNACRPGNNGDISTAGAFTFPTGLALNQTTGDVYVADRGHNRIDEYDAGGKFILAFGKEVNGDNASDICHQGEPCLTGKGGQGVGALGGEISAITVEQQTGDVYVADIVNDRVIEYSSEGQFILTFGGHVNKTQTEAHAGATAENVCTAASGDECQAGTEGTGPGEFTGWPSANDKAASFMAAGGAAGEEHVYVGDKERIQELTAAGAPVASIDTSQLGVGYSVYSLAVDKAGNIYTIAATAFGFPSTSVHKYNAAGEEQTVQLDPGQTSARSVTLANEGQVILIQSGEACGVSCNVPHHGVVYEENGKLLLASFGEGDFTWGSPAVAPGGAYNNTAKQFYTVEEEGRIGGTYGGGQVLIFKGLAMFPNVGTTSAQEIEPGVWRLTSTVTAEELEIAETSFEYGTCGQAPPNPTTTLLGEKCAGKGYPIRVPAHVVGTGETKIPAGQSAEIEAVVKELDGNAAYHARADASNLNGDGRSKQPGVFVTRPRAADAGVVGVRDLSARAARLTGSVNPQNAASTYRFEYGACVPLSACGESVAYTVPVSVGEGAKPVVVSRMVGGLAPETTYSYRVLTLNSFAESGQSGEATFTTGPVIPPGVLTGASSGVSLNAATLSGTVEPRGLATGYRFELGVDHGAQTLWGVAGEGSAGESENSVAVAVALNGLQPGTAYRYRLVADSSEGEAQGAQATFTTLSLPAVFTLPPAPELLPQEITATPTATVASVVKKVTIEHRATRQSKSHKSHRKAHRSAHRRKTASGTRYRKRRG